MKTRQSKIEQPMSLLSKMGLGILLSLGVSLMAGSYDGDRRGHSFRERHSFMGEHSFMMEDIDLDDNQSISKSEIEARRDKIFNVIDENKDGKISQEEFVAENLKKAKVLAEINYFEFSSKKEAAVKKRMIDRFGNLDDDNDDFISKDEMISSDRMDELFERFDKDNNGKISHDEWGDRDRHRKEGRHRDGDRNKREHKGKGDKSRKKTW